MLKRENELSRKGLDTLVNDVADTYEELRESVNRVQKLERQSMLIETQNLIDIRKLKLALNREKYRNKELTKFIMSGQNPSTNYSDDENSSQSVHELRRVLQTRDAQLRKGNRKIQRLVEENDSLKQILNEQQNQIREMEHSALVVAAYLSDLQDKLQETVESHCAGDMGRWEVERAYYEDQIVDLTTQLDKEVKINAQLDTDRMRLVGELSKFETKRHHRDNK